MASTQSRKQRALACIPEGYLQPPGWLETFEDSNTVKERFQCYAFSQGFAITTGSHSEKNCYLVLECKFHKATTKNWRNTPAGKKKRVNTKVSANDCPFRLRITRGKAENGLWKTVKIALEHNHKMSPDPFLFVEHRNRDPDRDSAISQAIGLRTAGIKYKQAQRVLLTRNIRLPAKDCWNLIRSSKLSKEEQVQVTLDTLEAKGFHVRCHKKYHVEENIRQKQVIEAFFFCSPEQVSMTRRFVSSFVMQTDATFNTNELNMTLSILLRITNTLASYPVAYCFISSESADAFIFIHVCCKEIFFWNNCPRPEVILGGFSLGLSAALVKTIYTTMVEAGMEQVSQLVNQVDSMGTNCTLQLCSWHAVEAVKAGLVREGYPKHVREKKENSIHSLIWRWIHSETLADLESNREILASELQT